MRKIDVECKPDPNGIDIEIPQTTLKGLSVVRSTQTISGDKSKVAITYRIGEMFKYKESTLVIEHDSDLDFVTLGCNWSLNGYQCKALLQHFLGKLFDERDVKELDYFSHKRDGNMFFKVYKPIFE